MGLKNLNPKGNSHMIYLLIFVLGIVFITLILPLINNIVERTEASKEVYISQCTVEITKDKIDLQKYQLESQASPVSAIGFHYTDETMPICDEADDEDFEEEDEDFENKTRTRRIGF